MESSSAKHSHDSGKDTEPSSDENALDGIKALSQEEIREIVDVFLAGKVVFIRWANKRELPPTFVSRNIYHLIGYHASQITSGEIRLTDLFDQEELEMFIAEVRDFTSRGERLFEQPPIKIKRIDGTFAWVTNRTHIVRDDSQEAAYYISQWIDVSDLIEARSRERQSTHLSNSIIENAPVAITISDVQGKVLLMNSTGLDQLGYTEDDIFSLHLNDILLNEEDRNKVRIAIQAGGSVEGMDLPMKTKCGKEMMVSVYSRIIEYNDQPAFLTMALDVTFRRHVEDVLRESEARHRAMFRTSAAGMHLINMAGQYKDVNTALVQMLGRSSEELVGMKITDVTHPDDIQKTRKLLNTLATGETETARIEKRYIHKDGSILWVDLTDTAISNATGQPELALGVIVDITARKKAEHALKESEATARVLLNATSDVITLINEDGTILDMNEPSSHLMEMSRQKAIGECLWDIMPDNVAAPRKKNVAMAYRTKKPVIAENPHEKAWFETMVYPILDKEGNVTRLAMRGRDITERKKAEEQRLQLEAKFREAQRLESLSLLAGGVAHDFNNLLAGVLGNAGLALMDLPVDHPARSAVEQIETAAERAAELTRQMLAYSGHGKFIVEFFDVSGLVHEMEDMIRTLISPKARLKFMLPDLLEMVKGDTGQIRQVVMNLLINASEALENREGTISITTGMLYCARSFFYGLTVGKDCVEGNYLFIEIDDSGVGMNADIVTKMYDPFFSTKFTGRGLGLAATLGIVKGHNGAIKVSSKPGKGSRFTVFLPSSGIVNQEKSLQRKDDAATAMRILVVDKDNSMRTLAKRILVKAGYSVVDVDSCEKALEMMVVDKSKYGLVLVDLTDEKLLGENQTVELIRNQTDTPVIITTGLSVDEVKMYYANLPHVQFLEKPYRPNILLEMIHDLPQTDAPSQG